MIPAFATLYQRLTLPESTRYEETQRSQNVEAGDEIAELKRQQEQSNSASGSLNKGNEERKSSEASVDAIGVDNESLPPEALAKKKAHFKEFVIYFSEWRHLRLLIGTAACWFLLDIAFYGINLNQNVVLQQIGYDGSSGSPWQRLFKISTGNMIVTALGFVPGYYASVLTIEKLGRKWIQIQGFLVTSLFRMFPTRFITKNVF